MGAFGNFSLSGAAPPGEKRPGFGSMRSESRFKNIIGKESSEDLALRVKEKSSFGNLEKLPEAENEAQRRWEEPRGNRPLRSATNPFGEEEGHTGSAALGGAQEGGHSNQGIDQVGFSPFGMNPNTPGLRELMQQHYQQQQTPQSQHASHEPMSPTNTNPYQSPEGEKSVPDDINTEDSDGPRGGQYHGFGPMQGGQPIGRGPSAQPLAPGDRSQTSSVGPNRGFPSLGGLGGLSGAGGQGGWPSAGGLGTPSRDRGGFSSGFGDSVFGPLSDMQSPSLANIGAGGFFGSNAPSAGTIGRGSKMGSLFPSGMQEQMRGGEQGRQGTDFDHGLPRRETDNSSRAGRGALSDLLGSLEPPSHSMRDSSAGGDPLQGFGSSSQLPQYTSGPAQSDGGSQGGPGMESGSPATNQLPASQQRTMVMPDRMKWIYRDPQGNTQGPWSGLEMHDWYKAGFFSPELQVKKLEDTEYEPLAQLIRRIGNSREPFLVPQIGVPHGPPSAQPSQWPPTSAAGNTAATAGPSSAAQPPFASSFPSFGTTLTAEQQNALERRKQEEQYLMARQKEHLAQQQVLLKQMQMQGMHHQLQHHSSAHSLQSQPSYGSITSPSAYQPSPGQAPIQPPQPASGMIENSLRQNVGSNVGMPNFANQLLSNAREDEIPGLLERLNMGGRSTQQHPFGQGQGQGQSFGERQQELQSGQVQQMLQDRARLQREQEQYDAQGQSQSTFGELREHDERLRQFQALRSQTDDLSEKSPETIASQPIGRPSQEATRDAYRDASARDQRHEQEDARKHGLPGRFPMTEQVQKAAAASAQHAPSNQNQSPWTKIESGMPQPFPPPQSSSPLPAPAAQRTRSNVADALVADSRSQTQTPIETPSTTIAPWAKEPAESSKGPSLKEIQEAEARKAAQQEEIAAAARRAIAEQERLTQASSTAVAPAPGLPSSSTWGSGVSPATPTVTGPSAWAKAPVGKAATPTGAAAKKTLAQIQKEEETRKQRLAAANAAGAAASPGAAPSASAGKRYADLASKIAASAPQPAAGGAWTTVGASGKVKTPGAPAPATPTAPRAVSGTVAPTAAKARPTAPARSSTLGANAQNKAHDEFTKWAKGALGKGLNSTINGIFPSLSLPSLMT